MINKRGLSQIVITILFVLIGLVAIGIIWIAMKTFFLEGAQGLTLTPLTLDLQIESYSINESSGMLTIKVSRNSGKGDLTAIKFIIEDTRNAEIHEEILTSEFPELAKRTFPISLFQLSVPEGKLIFDDIYKISIAPIYYSDASGKDVLGSIADTIDVNIDINETSGGGGEEALLGQYCDSENPCPENSWIDGSELCELNSVTKIKRSYECIFTSFICIASTERVIIETCDSEEICYNGACITELIPCVTETDCGLDGTFGQPGCQISPPAIVQDYKDFSCEDRGEGLSCYTTTSLQTNEICEPGEICANQDGTPECFKPLQCEETIDCWNNASFGFGYVCDSGVCIPEVPLGTGTVNSAWPYGIGEYFDSTDLPQDDEYKPTGKFIIFPGSAEDRCLKIVAYYDLSGSIPYVRLNVTSSNVAASNQFQIWETLYSCSQI